MSVLIQVGELRDRLGEVTVIDCRHRLADPAEGVRLHREGHLPGARHAHLDRDLSGPVGPSPQGHSGRHPLPAVGDFLALLGRLGVEPGRPVAVYDDAGGAIAARLWWMLRAVGHREAVLLDGGIGAWVEEGLALEDGEVEDLPAPPCPARQASFAVASFAEVRAAAAGREGADWLLLDAREAERYRGEREPIDPRAGHIPGALSAPFQENLDARGRFRPARELRERFERLLGGRDPKTVVSYCGSGVTACHNLVAMEIAGLRGARLFVESWSGWCHTVEP